MVLEILVVVVEILDQDLEVTLEEDLMDMEVVVDLGMAIMGMEEDLEVGATEVVMTTMEEEIMEVEIIMILEIITSNLLTMVQ